VRCLFKDALPMSFGRRLSFLPSESKYLSGNQRTELINKIAIYDKKRAFIKIS
jgi:hypothetical protein